MVSSCGAEMLAANRCAAQDRDTRLGRGMWGVEWSLSSSTSTLLARLGNGKEQCARRGRARPLFRCDFPEYALGLVHTSYCWVYLDSSPLKIAVLLTLGGSVVSSSRWKSDVSSASWL